MQPDSPLDPSIPLKDKRAERFAVIVVGGASYTEAYEKIGLKRHSGNAYTYSQRPDVKPRMAWLIQESARKVVSGPVERSEQIDYNRETAMTDARAAYEMAMENKSASAAVSAVTLMARLAGIPLDDDARTDMTDREGAKFVKNLQDPRIVGLLRSRMDGSHVSKRIGQFSSIQPEEIIDVEPIEVAIVKPS